MSHFYPSNVILKVDDFVQDGQYDKARRFLDVIIEKDIKASIGLVGNTLDKLPLDIIERLKDKRFELWNHSMNHQQTIADIEECQKEIRRVFGIIPDLYGAPCNNISPEIYAEFHRLGLQKAFGIFDHESFEKVPRKYPITAYRELENQTPSGMIDWGRFMAMYEKEHVGLKTYQLHPLMWEDKDFVLFERAIDLMIADGKHFVHTNQPIHEPTNYTLDDVTFIIQTFKRPDELQRLLDSIKEFYPNQTVLVYDDSEFDRGLSWGRNWLVSQVKTPLYLLLDDDFVFTPQTKIERLLDKLNKGYDMVSGAIKTDNICHYEGRYTKRGTELEYATAWEEPYDFVFNFFLAHTDVNGWDESLKLAEHTAFFLAHQNTWKIGYEPECVIDHRQVRTEEYNVYRVRAKQFFLTFLKRFGFTRVHGIGGETLVNK